MKRPEHSSAPEDIKLLKQILQMTNEQAPFETIYHVEESNKIHVTELFDISDCEDTALQTAAERELNQMLEFDIDDWGDAEFGEGAAGGDPSGWDEDFPDDDLFPVEVEQNLCRLAEVEERHRQQNEVMTRTEQQKQMGQEETYDDASNTTTTPDYSYIFSDTASKALHMSQEYNEMMFGTFRHTEFDEEDEEDEEGNGKVYRFSDSEKHHKTGTEERRVSISSRSSSSPRRRTSCSVEVSDKVGSI